MMKEEPSKKKTVKVKTETKEKTKKPAVKKVKTEKPEVKKKTEAKPKTREKETKKPEAEKELKKEVETVAEKEGKTEYKVKKKPKLSKELKEKLGTRKMINNRRPEFLREEWFRYKRLPQHWRRPDGITSKMRRHFKYRPNVVSIGFRGPKETRGLHPSGFQEVIVHNVNDLQRINPDTQAARIGGTVGTKKRIDIEKKAEELDIRILNM